MKRPAGSLRLLAMLAAVANLVLIAALLLELRDLAMKNPLKLAALAVACIVLPGCSTLGGLTGPEKLALLKGASEHLQTCARSYTLNSGIPPSSGVTIICAPVTPAASPAPAPGGLTVDDIVAIATEAALKAVEAFTEPPT